MAIPPLSTYCDFVWQDPATFLNLYMPLRLHPMTRSAINNIIVRHKPKKRVENEEKIDFSVLTDLTPPGENETDKKPQDDGTDVDLYYYGLLMVK